MPCEFVTAHAALVYKISGVLVILAIAILVTGALIVRFERIPLEGII